jgi:hypothetical protein
MRHAILAITVTLSAACSACASLPSIQSQQAACQRANTTTLTDRVADPCGWADALAECVGLPTAERDRILQRCRAEKSAASSICPE